MKILQYALALAIIIASTSSPQSPGHPEPVWATEFDTLEEIYRQSWNQPVRWGRVFPQGDGVIVGWTDGPYALQAYLVMYEATRNPVYLDRFAQRAKQLLDLRWDANGDGITGWPASKYSNDMLGNGDFEDGGIDWGLPVLQNDSDERVMILGGLTPECSIYAGENLGNYRAMIAPSQPITRVIPALPEREDYMLSAAARLAPDSRLAISVNGDQTTIVQSTDRGPEGWQYIAIPIKTNSPSIEVGFTALDGNIEIDNVKLQSFEEYLVIDASMATVLAHFASLKPNHPFTAEFTAVAEELTHKWDDDYLEISVEKAIYRAPDDNSFNIPTFTLPYNMMANPGLAHLWLADLDPQGGHLEKAIMLGNTLRAALRPNPKHAGGVVWNYREALIVGEPLVKNTEDMSHAGITVKFISELFRRGLVFSSEEVQKVTEALTLSWNGSDTIPEYTRYVGGLGAEAPPDWGMFYKSHLELSPQLMQVTSIAYAHFSQYRECRVQSQNTGAEMLVPR